MYDEGEELIRFTRGRLKGCYGLQFPDNNQWGFSLVTKDGFISPGGFDFAPCEWVASKRKWPKWAIEWMQEW